MTLVLSLALLMTSTPSPAETVPDFDRHIRITEPWLRHLFTAGMSGSETFRSLVARLEESDVVVYLQTDIQRWPGASGRLTFLSVVAGTRYVVVRLTPLRSPVQQLAMIGHELQHAVEVAERPAIVDSESMFREYMRFGYQNGVSGEGAAFDTKAAMQAGARVSDELRDAPLMTQRALLP